jgi:hypothetical protein
MRVFRVNDCDWWMAENAQQARTAAIDFYGTGPDDVYALDEIAEVSEEAMDRLKVGDEDDGKTRTFREQVAKRIKDGATKPEIFASTEY